MCPALAFIQAPRPALPHCAYPSLCCAEIIIVLAALCSVCWSAREAENGKQPWERMNWGLVPRLMRVALLLLLSPQARSEDHSQLITSYKAPIPSLMGGLYAHSGAHQLLCHLCHLWCPLRPAPQHTDMMLAPPPTLPCPRLPCILLCLTCSLYLLYLCDKEEHPALVARQGRLHAWAGSDHQIIRSDRSHQIR